MKDIDRMERLIGVAVICVILIAAIFMSVRLWQKRGKEAGPAALSETPAAVAPPTAPAPVLDYDQVGKETPLNTLMEKRKEDLGFTKGVDIIAKPNESLKIGKSIVSMQEILDQIRLEEGDIIEKKLDEQGTAQTLEKNPENKLPKPGQSPINRTGKKISPEKFYSIQRDDGSIEKKPDEQNTSRAQKKSPGNMQPKPGNPAINKTGKKISPEKFYSIQRDDGSIEKKPDEQDTSRTQKKNPENMQPNIGKPAVNKTGKTISAEEFYGIHVVQPGDNIWNIHFRFMKGYFEHRGIALPPLADEPDTRGISSGVGKVLKFSEKMVYIYNVTQRKIDRDLNMIQPMTKIVIFKMKAVFALMDQIDHTDVGRIQFDGEALWLPAQGG